MDKPAAKIGLKHGSGARCASSSRMCSSRASPVDGIGLSALDDGAAIRVGDRWLVITTDSHVVHPIFFRARTSAAQRVRHRERPRHDGRHEPPRPHLRGRPRRRVPRADLERIVASMRDTAREANAPIVTGDTKVMGKGEVDGIILNTTGVALAQRVVTDAGLRAGDRIIVTAPSAITAWRSCRSATICGSRAISAPTSRP